MEFVVICFYLVRAFEFVLGVLGVLSGHRKSIAKTRAEKNHEKRGNKKCALKKKVELEKGPSKGGSKIKLQDRRTNSKILEFYIK